MKRAVIFLNGDRPTRELVFRTITTTDVIICADGGAKHVIDSGLTPQVIIGDLDSIPKMLLTKLKRLPIKWVTLSSEKDFTDSELALRYAIEHGFYEIAILGVTGDRADHMLANIMLFAKLVKENDDLAITVAEEEQTLYFVRKKLSISGKKGQTVSLLSLYGDAEGVSTRGLKWKLRNEVLHFGEPRGVSNEITTTKASITLASGVLLVVSNR